MRLNKVVRRREGNERTVNRRVTVKLCVGALVSWVGLTGASCGGPASPDSIQAPTLVALTPAAGTALHKGTDLLVQVTVTYRIMDTAQLALYVDCAAPVAGQPEQPFCLGFRGNTSITYIEPGRPTTATLTASFRTPDVIGGAVVARVSWQYLSKRAVTMNGGFDAVRYAVVE
jgi:hypothetical protein